MDRDYNKYIGVKFKRFGRTLEGGVDCYGLARLIMTEQFGYNVPDWNIEEFNKKSMKMEIDKEKVHFRKIDNPVPGCVGLFMFHGLSTHVATYIGDKRVIHILEGEMSYIDYYERENSRLYERLEGWYEYIG